MHEPDSRGGLLVGTRLKVSKLHFKPALAEKVVYSLKSYPRRPYFLIEYPFSGVNNAPWSFIGTPHSILPVFLGSSNFAFTFPPGTPNTTPFISSPFLLITQSPVRKLSVLVALILSRLQRAHDCIGHGLYWRQHFMACLSILQPYSPSSMRFHEPWGKWTDVYIPFRDGHWKLNRMTLCNTFLVLVLGVLPWSRAQLNF